MKQKNWTKEEIMYWQNLSDEEFEEHLRKMQEKREKRNWLRLLKIQIAALILNIISIVVSVSYLLVKLL